MKTQISSTGFINVVEKVFKAPIGPWPRDPKMKELGNWGLLELEVGLEGFMMAFLTRILGVSILTLTILICGEMGLGKGEK